MKTIKMKTIKMKTIKMKTIKLNTIRKLLLFAALFAVSFTSLPKWV